MRLTHTGPWSITRGIATVALLGVAALWASFAIAAGVIGGPTSDALAQALMLTVPLLAATAIVVFKPRYGGYGLILAGLFAFWFFADTTAWMLLALPLVLVGAALAVVGRRPHTPAIEKA